LAICVQKESKEEEVNIIYQSVFQNVLQLEDYFSASGRFIGDSFVVAEYITSDRQKWGSFGTSCSTTELLLRELQQEVGLRLQEHGHVRLA